MDLTTIALRLSSSILALAAITAPTRAQNILFAEDFDAGIPSSWVHFTLDVPIDPWSAGVSPVNASPDIFHEWFCDQGGQNRRNVLMSPRIDLSGFWRATFQCKQHQLYPTLRSLNLVQATTDGGQTFSTLYSETGTWSGPGAIQLSLDAYAGLGDVRIAFYYEGAIANEWRIDDVRVTTPQPLLDLTSLNVGTNATFDLRGASPFGLAVFAYSIQGGGPLTTPFGPVGLTPPIETLSLSVADGNGAATTTLPIPAAALGITLWAQAAELRADGSVELSRHTSDTIQ